MSHTPLGTPYLPASHCRHDVAWEAEYVPMAQTMHLSALTALLYWPGGHGSQACGPLNIEYVPASQSVHAVLPNPVLKVP